MLNLNPLSDKLRGNKDKTVTVKRLFFSTHQTYVKPVPDTIYYALNSLLELRQLPYLAKVNFPIRKKKPGFFITPSQTVAQPVIVNVIKL